MRYMKKIVTLCIILCTAYLPVYFLCSKLGVELPDTLTQCWYTFCGTELCMTMVIKVTEKITSKKHAGDPAESESEL